MSHVWGQHFIEDHARDTGMSPKFNLDLEFYTNLIFMIKQELHKEVVYILLDFRKWIHISISYTVHCARSPSGYEFSLICNSLISLIVISKQAKVKSYIGTAHQVYSSHTWWGEIIAGSRVLGLMPTYSNFKRELNLNFFVEWGKPWD